MCALCGALPATIDGVEHPPSACPGRAWEEVPWSREEVGEALGECWTLTDFAEAVGVSRSAPTNWSHRFADFPTPVARFGSFGVYHRAELLAWHERRRQGGAMTLHDANKARAAGWTPPNEETCP